MLQSEQFFYKIKLFADTKHICPEPYCMVSMLTLPICLSASYSLTILSPLQTIIQLGDWTFYGLGFLMGQFFYMKYVVVYGLLSTVANFDGYDAPPPPKCVARIHLYTDMWRFFDVGFYQFMHK